ncbi:autotransporter outer membrane beta-barrel domain-containing protein [Notoacmeibacter ruber]|uniref:autotransporter outer membrane beta-barrel domain-containing protein n=1 Tax=Notoacmeibacter ruber TaxID=2670375 RepID=UPI001AECFCD5|nr:autotransporter outer membrane beta-barrel domain-containing protein [Notoacmeibacter ruber]
MGTTQRLIGTLAAGVAVLAIAAPSASAESLTTTFDSNNELSGNFFDINVLTNQITITALDINTSLSPRVRVFTRLGTAKGNTGSATGWVDRGTYNVTPAGEDNPTSVDLVDFALAGGTYGFLVTTDDDIHYKNGGSYSDIVAQNANLEITGGQGTSGTVDSPFGGTIINLRTWNGTIYYLLGLSGPSDESLGVTDQQNAYSSLLVVQGGRSFLNATSGVIGERFGFAGSAPTSAPLAFGPEATKEDGPFGHSRESVFNADIVTPGYMPPRFHAWISGDVTGYDGDGDSFDGGLYGGSLGIDYTLSDRIVLGLFAGYGASDFDTVTRGIGGGFDADAYTVGGYAGFAATDALTLSLTGGYTHTEYDLQTGGTTGEFDGDGGFVAADAKYSIAYGGFNIVPRLSAIYAVEEQDGYTDSDGVDVDDNSVHSGRVAFGTRLYRSLDMFGSRPLVAFVGAEGGYDFSDQDVAAASGLPDFGDQFSASFDAGATVEFTDSAAFTLEGQLSGIGTGDYVGYGGKAQLSVRF